VEPGQQVAAIRDAASHSCLRANAWPGTKSVVCKASDNENSCAWSIDC
jgi:hypothetical protein